MSTVTSSIDWSPVIAPLLTACGIIITGLFTTLVKAAVRKFHLDANAQAVDMLDDAAAKAITHGIAQVDGMIRAKGWDHEDVKSATIARAANYIVDKFPDALKANGLDSNDPMFAEKINTLLARAFPAVALEASKSPVMPDQNLTKASILNGPAPIVMVAASTGSAP